MVVTLQKIVATYPFSAWSKLQSSEFSFEDSRRIQINASFFDIVRLLNQLYLTGLFLSPFTNGMLFSKCNCAYFYFTYFSTFLYITVS